MKIPFLITGLLALSTSTAFSQTIPNGGFENWNVINYNEPDSVWLTSNSQSITRDNIATVSYVTGFSGKSIHIQTAIVGTDTLEAYISNGADPIAGIGGVPYSQKPSYFTGYYRYGLAGNDSAILIVTFKKNGSVLSTDVFMIGGSQAAFTPFSFPLTVPSVPDTVIIAATSSNLLPGNGNNINNGSWLELDSLAFTGTSVSQNIPEGGFEIWSAATFEQAIGWAIQPANNDLYGAIKTTDRYNGSYAIKLVTEGIPGSSNGIVPSAISSGQQSQSLGLYGGRPFALMTDTLTGYYKYIAPVGDTGIINISLTKNGTDVGDIVFNLPPETSYTYFEIPIAATMNPDTMRVDIYSSCWSYQISSLSIPGSALFVDNLQLKSQSTPTSVTEINNKLHISAFPNPAKDILNFDLKNIASGDVKITLYDMTGKVQIEQSYNPGSLITIPINELPSGIYLYKINGTNINVIDKFLKQ